MRHHNSVFHGLLKHLPWGVFERLVEKHGADARVRQLSTKSQLVALLYGQLSGASSLREVEAGLQSQAVRLYHLGAKPARRSTLSDANAQRPAALFGELFAHMARTAHADLQGKIAEAVYLIDATPLPLNALSQWARFSKDIYGAKLHVIYDAACGRPAYSAVSTAKVNDITVAKAMPIKPGATYVFDLGYYDYAWWAKLDAEGCRIVTRFKSNTPLTRIKERRLPKGSSILSDRTGFLPARQAKSRENPMAKAVREVRVRTETGKVLRILSNDLKAKAQEIADLYKSRWQIELFFRWIKQTLKITRFLGTSENAIRIQIAIALIAFLLLRLAQGTQDAVSSPLNFARLVRHNLMQRKRIDRLTEPETTLVPDPDQPQLQWA